MMQIKELEIKIINLQNSLESIEDGDKVIEIILDIKNIKKQIIILKQKFHINDEDILIEKK